MHGGLYQQNRTTEDGCLFDVVYVFYTWQLSSRQFSLSCHCDLNVPPRSAAAGFVIMETIEQAQWIVNNLNGCAFAKVKMVSGVKLMSLQLLVNRNSRSSGCPTISGVIDYARVESNGFSQIMF